MSIRIAILAILMATLPAARANAATNIRIEQETVGTIGEEGIEIAYTTQLNRPAAYFESLKMDADSDGHLFPEEQATYFADLGRGLAAGLELSIDGREIPLAPAGDVELSMPLRKTYRFEVPHPSGWRRGAVIELYNDNYLDYPGKITIEIDPGTTADVVHNSLWQRTDEQPDDTPLLGLADPQQRDVVFRYRQGTGVSEPPDDFVATAAPAPEVAGTESPQQERTRAGPAAVALAAVALALGLLAVVTRPAPSVRLAASTGAVLAAVACPVAWYATEPAPAVAVPNELEAADLFQQLHRNIYRAFESRTESDIYDTLALGLDGDVLDQVYNEVYEAMRMQDGGETRFSIRRVKPLATEIHPAKASGTPAFRVRYRWRVYGTVSHVKHTHARFNEYEAVYLVQYNGRAWRITDTEVQQNMRVSIGES